MTIIATPEGAMREILAVAPAAQASAQAETVLAGSEMDARPWKSLAYTLTNITQTITVNFYGANASDYSDEVLVSGPTDIAASAASSYAVEQAAYGFYRVKILDKVGGVHGTCTLRGICKN